jgi:hypothetical protein
MKEETAAGERPRSDVPGLVSRSVQGVRAFAPWAQVGIECSIAVLAASISLLLAVLALRISPSDLTHRWLTGGPDQVLHYMIFTSATDVFPFFPNDRMGFPSDQNLFFAPLFDPWSALFVQAIAPFANGVVALNLYLLASFAFVGATSYFFLRALAIRRILSVTFAVIFSVAPYHFYQVALGHPFLANYWTLPLLGILCLMVAGERTNPFARWIEAAESRGMRLWRRWLPILVLGACLAWTQSYYFVFGVLILSGVWLPGAIRALIERRRLRTLLWPTVTLATVTILVAVQLAVLALDLGDRYERYFGERSVADSEIYGGKITSLLFPWVGSGVGPLARFAQRYQAESPLLSSTESPSTAIIASAGMVLLTLCALVMITRRGGRSVSGTALARIADDERTSVLAIGFLWGLLLFVAAGLGAIFAFIVSPEIRAWTRMSIILAMFGTAFIALLLDRLVRRRWVLVTALIVISGVAFVDQIAGVSRALPISAAVDSTTPRFVAELEAELPRHCGVVQLPLKGFPETGPIGAMGDYDQSLPYIYAADNTLRWSYGAVRGTESGSYWQGVDTPAEFAAAVSETDACAVVVDTLAYVDDPDGWQEFVAAVADPDKLLSQSEDREHRYLAFDVAERR